MASLIAVRKGVVPITLLAWFTTVMLTACIPALGDPSRDVLVENQTQQRVVLYTFSRDPRFKEELAPGQVFRDSWLYPLRASDKRKVRVEADDERGMRLFCADFSYDDLVRLNWRIAITSGRNGC